MTVALWIRRCDMRKTREEAGYRKAYHACCSNCYFLKGTTQGYLECTVVADTRFRVQVAAGAQDAFQEGERMGRHVCNAFELHPNLIDDQEM